DGRRHVEWYTTAPGVTWLPGWVAAHLGPRVRAVVVDERGAVADLDWPAVRVRPTLVGHREVAVAAGLFSDAVTDGTLAHRGQAGYMTMLTIRSAATPARQEYLAATR